LKYLHLFKIFFFIGSRLTYYDFYNNEKLVMILVNENSQNLTNEETDQPIVKRMLLNKI